MHISVRSTVIAAAALAAVGPAARASEIATKAVGPSPDQPVQFGQLIADLPAGTRWLTMRSGMLCEYPLLGASAALEQPAGLQSVKKAAAFAVKHSSLNTVGDTDRQLFGDAAGPPADLVISGSIVSLEQRVCRPLPFHQNFKGNASVTIEWRLYSKSQNAVLAAVKTTGEALLKSAEPGGPLKLLEKATESSVEKMAQSPEFRQALAAKPERAGAGARPAAQPPIALLGSLAAAPRGMDPSADSVVLLSTPDGHGSGFLVSKDGYLLTDAHVVAGQTKVKVRWSDGVEADGSVVRLDKGRDVALVWTDPRGHAPLPLRRDAPARGDTVFAIGAPLDKSLQGTVVRGIISAHRVEGGYDLLQSDASVNHGMSGGPVLDDKGRVVALVESALQLHANVPEGINFFTPIDDALKYLSLTPQ